MTYEGEKIDTNNNYKSFITVSNFSTVMNSNDLISRFKSFTSFNMSLLEIPMNFYYSTFIGYKKSCFEKYEKKPSLKKI